MKYGEENTHQGKHCSRRVTNNRDAKPSTRKYFLLKQWLVNKKRKIAKAEKQRKE